MYFIILYIISDWRESISCSGFDPSQSEQEAPRTCSCLLKGQQPSADVVAQWHSGKVAQWQEGGGGGGKCHFGLIFETQLSIAIEDQKSHWLSNAQEDFHVNLMKIFI